MYSEKWGAIEVPRFAASIVDTPLKPQTVSGDVENCHGHNFKGGVIDNNIRSSKRDSNSMNGNINTLDADGNFVFVYNISI